MIIYILYFILIIFFSTTVLYFFKYKKLKKSIKEYEEIGTGRYGFYINKKYSPYSSIVYINEIDRYKDGYSKIVIDEIEPHNKHYIKESKKLALQDFISLKEINDIEWLESENNNIKKERQEKLKNIKKIFKNK